ncbi:MAG: bifunctional 4-hydroxy-2-oxoglutarate aldolase/2-dehydro-3-deoxy-phosphogluconate aldolase [Dongiaceae bacterium]
MDMRDILGRAPVIPVVAIDDAAAAVPLARALVEGGLPVIEVTLRTGAAAAAARAMIEQVPGAIVGLGTVTRRNHVAEARKLGARFIVSPGFAQELADLAQQANLPYLPGVVTPTELMLAQAAGLTALKFFPAEPAGGVAVLKALHGPFPDVAFCPTGGIDAAKAPAYLALPNVLAVGGSWLTPKAALDAGDWPAITALARAAANLPRAA